MDKLDTYLGIIIDKIELALNKLAIVEKTKSTKFESMNKILDAIIDENDESKFLTASLSSNGPRNSLSFSTRFSYRIFDSKCIISH